MCLHLHLAGSLVFVVATGDKWKKRGPAVLCAGYLERGAGRVEIGHSLPDFNTWGLVTMGTTLF